MAGLETDIIERFRSGDRAAFRDLVEIHRDRVYGLAYSWLRNREDTLDVSQEVFLRLYFFLPRWRRRAKLSTWLYRTTVNLCIDTARKRKRERRKTEEFARNLENTARAMSEPESSELGRIIREEIDGLPPRQKAVVLMRHYRHMPLKEIARVLGCATGTVKANLYFAIRSLRNRLEEKGVRMEGGS